METGKLSSEASMKGLVRESFFVRQKKKIASIVIIILLLVGGALVRPVFSDRVVGNIQRDPQETLDIPREIHKERLYQGKYINFSVDDSYSEKNHEIPLQGPVMERIWLVSPGIEGREIAVVVTKRSGGSLSEEPSYTARANNQVDYTSKTLTKPSFSVRVFTNHQVPFEAVAFLSKRGQVISISTTSLLENRDLEAELSQILESLTFPLW